MGREVDCAFNHSAPQGQLMVFRRSGRTFYEFSARTQTGWKQQPTGTTSKPLAGRIEAMWEALASEHRAWDLLEGVLVGRYAIGRLYDLWTLTKSNPVEMRRLISDTDLEPLVADYLKIHAKNVKPDTLDHIEKHLRELIPEGQTLLRSAVSTDSLTQFVYGYGGKRNTLRKVHSDISGFFEYLTRVKKLFLVNPMAEVQRPTQEESPVKFYELDVVEKIVDWQFTEARRSAFALSYGAGIEVTVLLGLKRSDFNLRTREVRTAGTKALTRDRMSRIADWAWPYVKAHIEDLLPEVELYYGWNRWTLSDWHRQTVKALDIKPRYALMNARDHWAVRAARAGTPIAVIQNQLGHSTPMLTLTKYGRFLPSASDREKWEKAATEYETQRRAAR